MKKSFLTLVALTVLAISGAQAQQGLLITIEKWRCFGVLDSRREKVLVTLSRFKVGIQDRERGQVSVAGVTYRADFRVVGLDRRWDFGEYAFTIRPDGDGSYYDFSDVWIWERGKTSPSRFFSCVVSP